MSTEVCDSANKPSTSKLSCCQSNDSNSESLSNDGDSIEMDYAQGNNNTLLEPNHENDYIQNLPKREKINLTFTDVRYTVKKLTFSRGMPKLESKEILHGLNGEFEAGKLTAIMGPSGAGKSTLLNIMAGYVCRGATGDIFVNGQLREKNSEQFKKLSCYIHQDDALRSYLTVKEYMTVATNLKLGFKVSRVEKLKLIKKILLLLGLDKRCNTFAGRLSGGQKKRLAIALELINNPPVLFLDEPTTGLDSSSCTKCITLLKKLAQEGRTVVCTIHQPSALLFELFDNLYTVSQGYCIFQGRIKELVPFLSDLGLNCPPYHNPADFLMEVAVGEYETDMPKMVNAATKFHQKALFDEERAKLNSESNLSPVHNESKKLNSDPLKHVYCYKYSIANNNNHNNSSNYNTLESITNDTSSKSNQTYPATWLMQFLLLYKRNLVSVTRNYFLLIARIIAHIAIAIIFGYIYVDVGQTANTVFGNYVYLYGTILLLVYTGKMSVMMSFPIEMEMLAREHFNRWYNLGPYFLSIILWEIPFQMLCASLYVAISYFLTGNYYEPYRFFYFLIMCLAATLCAQGWGFFIGSTLPVNIAVFIGPVLAVCFSVFGFCTRLVDITTMFKWMWHISYFRAGFHSVINSVYGNDRPYLNCPKSQMYCHFRDPKIFLTEMMIDDFDLQSNVILLGMVFCVTHVLTVSVLWFKLNKR